MSIDYVDNIAQFELKFPKFKENSKISVYPTFYHVGLDCEYIKKSTYPESFALSNKWTNKSTTDIAICLIQIANSKECLVIDITKFNKILPNGLIEVLTSGNWIKTGVGIDLDMHYIFDNFEIGLCNGHIDMKTHAILSGVCNPSLELLNGVSKFESVKQYDWSTQITPANIKYAGYNGLYSYNIGKQFLKISANAFSNKKTILHTDIINQNMSIDRKCITNYIGLLQEYLIKISIDKTFAVLPKYTDYEVDTKTHLFAVECKIKKIVGYGVGQNKMTAKQNAAKDVYNKLIQSTKN